VLVDYRSALRNRTGVGEYTHQLVAALLRAFPPERNDRPLDLTIFSSSWKDRLRMSTDLNGVKAIDRHIPVTVLNLAWHRFGWPSAESLTGATFDVTHSLHPLLLPARKAAHVITICDLNFLEHPERTQREIRRDYPSLTRTHAQQADRIIVISRFTASEVERQLDVPPERISICAPGAPDWAPRSSAPPHGYMLFLGTLEPRKNVGTLLDAYERLLSRHDTPELLIAGQATPDGRRWLERLARAPLAGRVRYLGYIAPDHRRALYEGARVLVQPSFEEGFGMPVVEAMTVGVPVVAANRGALPEVLGDAGFLVDPGNSEEMAVAIGRILDDDQLAASAAAKGVARAKDYRWATAAERVYEAYQLAMEHKCASA
jgi:glycosyltransferase involved in cell wall biosynthesis